MDVDDDEMEIPSSSSCGKDKKRFEVKKVITCLLPLFFHNDLNIFALNSKFII